MVKIYCFTISLLVKWVINMILDILWQNWRFCFEPVQLEVTPKGNSMVIYIRTINVKPTNQWPIYYKIIVNVVKQGVAGGCSNNTFDLHCFLWVCVFTHCSKHQFTWRRSFLLSLIRSFFNDVWPHFSTTFHLCGTILIELSMYHCCDSSISFCLYLT